MVNRKFHSSHVQSSFITLMTAWSFSLFFPPLYPQPETRLENWTPLSYSRGCGFWCLRKVPGEVEAGGADVFVGHDLLSAPGRSPALHPSTNYKLLLQPQIASA